LGAGGKLSVRLFAGPGSVGTHTITAIYDGRGSSQDSFSNSITLTVA
jgi:hypothetical protein